MGSATALLRIEPTREPAEEDVLHRITTQVESLGGIHLWGESLTYRVNLVLEELAVNILSYGKGEPREQLPGNRDKDHLRQGLRDDTGRRQRHAVQPPGGSAGPHNTHGAGR